MCYPVKRSGVFRSNQRLVTKDQLSSEERQILERFERAFGDALDGPQEDLVGRIRRGDVDISRLGAVRAAVESSFRSNEAEITSVYRQHQEEGVRAGRMLAAQQYSLSGSFDQVPERLVEELDNWSVESTGEVIDSMSDEVARVIRSGAEDGMSTDDIAQTVNDELFDGRLRDTKAEEVARTELNSASNRGSHSAYQDSGAIGEEWLSASDNRTRPTHVEANGQVVGIDTSFLIGDSEMDHPGDKSAPGDEWHNCRCTIAPVMADQLTEAQVETILDGGRLTGGV